LSAISLELHRLDQCQHEYLLDDVKEGPLEDLLNSDDRDSSSEFMSEYTPSTNLGEDDSDMMLLAVEEMKRQEMDCHHDDSKSVDGDGHQRRSAVLPTKRLSIRIPRVSFSSIKDEIKSVPDSLSHGFGGLMSKFKSKTPDPPRVRRQRGFGVHE